MSKTFQPIRVNWLLFSIALTYIIGWTVCLSFCETSDTQSFYKATLSTLRNIPRHRSQGDELPIDQQRAQSQAFNQLLLFLRSTLQQQLSRVTEQPVRLSPQPLLFHSLYLPVSGPIADTESSAAAAAF